MASENKTEQQKPEPVTTTKPDENSGIVVTGAFRIFDPTTNKTIIEGKA